MDKYAVPEGVITQKAAIENLRCWRCDKLLAEMLTKPYIITCPRCKGKNTAK